MKFRFRSAKQNNPNLPSSVSDVHYSRPFVQKHSQAVLRQAICRHQRCQRLFFICRYCDRGQVYCSTECRHIARREQHRAANRRYSQSIEAILDHRQRQNDYRRRKAGLPPRLKEIVTDHTSASPPRSARIGRPGLSSLCFGPEREPLGRFCGRPGRFITSIWPFDRVPPGKRSRC